MCAPIRLPLGSLTLGALLPRLHMSLGLRLSFVPVSDFPLQTAAPPCHSFVFLLAPKAFVPFCTPPAFLVQSLCFTIDSGQLEKGGGQGLGPAQFRLRCLGRWILPSGIVWRGTSHPKGGFVSVANLNPGLEASEGMQGAAW